MYGVQGPYAVGWDGEVAGELVDAECDGLHEISPQTLVVFGLEVVVL